MYTYIFGMNILNGNSHHSCITYKKKNGKINTSVSKRNLKGNNNGQQCCFLLQQDKSLIRIRQKRYLRNLIKS